MHIYCRMNTSGFARWRYRSNSFNSFWHLFITHLLLTKFEAFVKVLG